MSFDWQDAMALIAVAVAGGYLARRSWLAISRKRAGCGGCGSCASSSGGPKNLVTIELPRKTQPGG